MAEPLIRPFVFTAGRVQELWTKFQENADRFPGNEGRDFEAFMQMIYAEDTHVFEMGNLGGVLVFTSVLSCAEAGPGQETMAQVHLYIWDGECARQYEKLREFGLAFLQHYGIYRVIAEVNVGNVAADRAVQAVGLERIGERKKRLVRGSDRTFNTVWYEALREDLERACETRRAS